VSSVVGDLQISSTYWRHLIAAIELAVSCSELYALLACCALKRTGIFALESKVTCL